MIAPINRALEGRCESRLDMSVLTERSAMMGLPLAGRRSANGTCRMIAAADGWIALNLARAEDVELIPALLQTDVEGDPWAVVEAAATSRTAADLVAQGTLLGLPR